VQLVEHGDGVEDLRPAAEGVVFADRSAARDLERRERVAEQHRVAAPFAPDVDAHARAVL
jgi:hypothetical protein